MLDLILFYKTNTRKEKQIIIKNVKENIDFEYIKELMYFISDNNIVDFNLKPNETIKPECFGYDDHKKPEEKEKIIETN